MIIRATGDTYFMLLARLFEESEFVASAGVREGSPGAEYAARMYACLFNALRNVSAEYERFYKIEYENVWHYLERNYFSDAYYHLNWSYSIGRNRLTSLKKHYSAGMNIFYGDVHSGGDYVMGQYVMSDEGFLMVEKILTKLTRGQRNEN